MREALPVGYIFVWVTSFYTGMGAMSYELIGENKYFKWLNQFYEVYFKKVYETPLETMHDLGFLYSPYAVAMYMLTGDENMKAMEALGKRLDDVVGYW